MGGPRVSTREIDTQSVYVCELLTKLKYECNVNVECALGENESTSA